MVVRGRACFWLMCSNEMIQCISVDKQRVDAHDLERMCGVVADTIFLTCCTIYAPGWKHVANQGMLGMLKQADVWNIIMLYDIDISKQILRAYKYVGAPSSVWSDLEDMLQRLTPFEVSFQNIGKNDLHWVNQCYGKVPFEPLAKDVVNTIDSKFQCSLKGPDYLPLFLHDTDWKLPIPSHFKE